MIVITFSCNKGPDSAKDTSEYKKIEKNSTESVANPHNDIDFNANTALKEELHSVVVNEILTASKYLYLNVNEGNEQFWIAVRKQEIKVGGMYYYKRALLKTNFESKENNKVFEKIYLVTNLVSADHGNGQDVMNDKKVSQVVAVAKEPEVKKVEQPERNIAQEGSIKIAELVANVKKYEGKTVQVSGECVKINPGIMNRNWIHIKDGSKDDYDLVITSDTYVEEGKVITMKATVSLNKDFGAGYTYDLILENGVLIP
jgi:hypothetical protein